MRFYGVFLVLDLVLIVFVIVVSALGHFDPETGFLIKPELATIIVTAALGIGGWLFTAGLSLIQRQKQHTLDVLLYHRLSDTFDCHHSRVYNRLLSMKVPQKGSDEYSKYREKLLLESTQDINFRISLMFLANFYEFLSTAISHKYLHERLLKDTYRAKICGYYERIEPYIDRVREKNPKTYQGYHDLYRKWSDKERSEIGVIGEES